MLTQYRVKLNPDRPCRVRPEWGYCLYAGLLKRAPQEFGAAVHRDQISPVSQYLTEQDGGVLWTVNLLGEACEQALIPALEGTDFFTLDKEGLTLTVADWEKNTVADTETLLALAEKGPRTRRLEFLTPTAFKSRGAYQNLPTTRLIIQNLMKQWNGTITDCPIEDEDGQGMEALADGLVCRDFRLHSRDYWLKGRPIHGFRGELTLENHLEGFHRQLAEALLLFSGFSGVGIKTTLGMGGVRLS